jgi:hypothetical protein
VIFVRGGLEGSTTYDFTPSAVVPESSTWAMMLMGFAGLGLVGYRRAKGGPTPGRRLRSTVAAWRVGPAPQRFSFFVTLDGSAVFKGARPKPVLVRLAFRTAFPIPQCVGPFAEALTLRLMPEVIAAIIRPTRLLPEQIRALANDLVQTRLRLRQHAMRRWRLNRRLGLSAINGAEAPCGFMGLGSASSSGPVAAPRRPPQESFGKRQRHVPPPHPARVRPPN